MHNGFVVPMMGLLEDFPQPSAELNLLDPSPYHFLTYYSHILLGTVAIIAAAIAIYSIKGGKWHRKAGTVYMIGMGIAALTAFITLIHNFNGPTIANAMIVIYAAGGAYLATRRNSALALNGDWALFALGLMTTITFGMMAGQRVAEGVVPAIAPLGIGLPLLVLLALDLNYLLRGSEYRRTHRLRRHVSRIAWALLVTVRAPVNELRDVIGINQPTVVFAPYLLVVVVLVLFWRKASRMEAKQRAG